MENVYIKHLLISSQDMMMVLIMLSKIIRTFWKNMYQFYMNHRKQKIKLNLFVEITVAYEFDEMITRVIQKV